MPPDFCANAPWLPSPERQCRGSRKGNPERSYHHCPPGSRRDLTSSPHLTDFPTIFEASIAASGGLGNDQWRSASKRQPNQEAGASLMLCAPSQRGCPVPIRITDFDEPRSVATRPGGRSLDRTDTSHSLSAAGMRGHAPHLPFAIPAGIGSNGWKPDIRVRFPYELSSCSGNAGNRD